MAGIWERVKPDAVDRLPVHLWEAMTIAYADGFASRAQIVNAINARLASPLNQNELDDLTMVADQMDVQQGISNEAKLDYLNAVRYAGIAAEAGAINETKFRSDLNLSDEQSSSSTS